MWEYAMTSKFQSKRLYITSFYKLKKSILPELIDSCQLEIRHKCCYFARCKFLF